MLLMIDVVTCHLFTWQISLYYWSHKPMIRSIKLNRRLLMGKHNYVIYSIFDASSLSVKKTESGSQRGYILGYYVCLVQDAVLVAVSSLSIGCIQR